MNKQTCQFIPASEIVPKWLVEQGFWSAFSDDAPFSWGDNNRTLITATRFAAHCRDVIFDITTKRAESFLRKLEKLDDTYIDLEN